MKKLFTLLLLLPLLAGACSSDKDDEYGGDVVGTWSLSSISVKEVETTSSQVTAELKKQFEELEVAVDSDVFIFDADGTVTEIVAMPKKQIVKLQNEGEKELTARVASVLSSRLAKENITSKGTWRTSDGVLYMTEEDNTTSSFKYKVKGNELTIEMDYMDLAIEMFEEAGMPGVVKKFVLAVVYTKQ